MNPVIIRSFLLVVWWIGLWGLIEILIHQFTKNSVMAKAIMYMGLLGLVAGTVALNPAILEHF